MGGKGDRKVALEYCCMGCNNGIKSEINHLVVFLLQDACTDTDTDTDTCTECGGPFTVY